MEEQLKIYIIEDMAITRAYLEDNLISSGYNVLGSSAKAENAWEDLLKLDVDLALIDIHLAGEKDGIWLARKIRENLDIPFVFLTAFGDDQTLSEVIDTKPNGYLMKPYNVPSLLTTIAIAIQNFQESKRSSALAKDSNADADQIFVKEGNLMVKLQTSDILYIQSDGNYLYIYTDEKRHVVRSKMSDFTEQLPDGLLLRVHQRYEVNKNKIGIIARDHLMVQDVKIPISGKYRNVLKESLNS